MHIILGGTGNIGSALAETLISRGEQITVISHDQKKKQTWEQKGAEFAVVDIFDHKELRKVFNLGERLFLLNPPAAPSSDTVTEEKKTLLAILKALEGSNIKKVVAESTYGAQSGDGIGDLGVLYSLEQGLAKMNMPADIIRAAYYMSNWAASINIVRETGKLNTMYPVNFKLPMVSPKDIGLVAAGLMLGPISQTGLHYVEGPEKYSANDVADAFASILQEPVEVVQTPKHLWIKSLEDNGFSEKAARSMVAMTEIMLKEEYEKPENPIRGRTSLQEYITSLIKSS